MSRVKSSTSGVEKEEEIKEAKETTGTTEVREKTEEELKRDFLSSLMEKVTKNPLTRKTQKKYHRASSDCESSEDEDAIAYVQVSRDEALKLSLKKLEERKKGF
ncbi:hypothetical protein IIV31_202L [Armadillidium vulgare iridescent virus]|uniref:Uncharacterized protein n=1 Tax=Armadillidium vulgare iridescent virus TaxID=72201 RepID=A0A068QLS2_9VIRU|nr:hypothetical protein IIV31_202L [Armadillidium vulgare iridescent virus]CCV02574.1 hypothetical protein IIV31_202L [Armadillidium vulgare iridescent virus]